MASKRKKVVKKPLAPGEKDKGGRPIGSYKTTFTEKDVRKIEVLSGYGLTMEQIADVHGVHRETFRRYMDDNPQLKAALESGRSKASAAVTQSAYQQAVSGKVPAMTMFWLKCRQRWKETHVIEHAGEIDINTQAESMTPEQRDERLQELAAELGYDPLTFQKAEDADDILARNPELSVVTTPDDT